MSRRARSDQASNVVDRRTGALCAALALLGSFQAPGAEAACDAAEPGEYRMERFRAPVPCTLSGAAVLTTQQLRVLLDGPAPPLLVDVLPSPRRPHGLSEDALWQPVERANIPGSVWLPNTGFGVLPVEEEAYLRDSLQHLTGGDRTVPLVFYCEADCWMSWNAARRALAWGYSTVMWYPDGTDGWSEAGLALHPSRPERRDRGR